MESMSCRERSGEVAGNNDFRSAVLEKKSIRVGQKFRPPTAIFIEILIRHYCHFVKNYIYNSFL